VVGIIRVEGQSRATAPSGWAVHVPPAVVAEREVVSGGPRRPRTRQPVQGVIGKAGRVAQSALVLNQPARFSANEPPQC
jgi:hypothetical protein